MDEAQAAALREPFPREAVGLLPRALRKEAPKGRCDVCGGYHGLPAIHLDYVGHAAVTDRLLRVDPEWTWEPVAMDSHGLPARDSSGGLWIRLTVAGVTRYGYGDAQGKTGGDATKEAIGDALRNAAMRFGVALDLWSKEELLPEVEKATRPDLASHNDPPPAPPREAADPPRPMTQTTRGRLFALLTERGITDEDVQRAGMSRILGRDVTSRSTLTEDEARTVIATLEASAPQPPMEVEES